MNADSTQKTGTPSDFRAKDILLVMYKEHADQARQHENQRERMTAVVFTLASAILGLMAIKESSSNVQPWFCVGLIILGLYGAVFSRKHYERNRMHTCILEAYRDELERHFPEAPLMKIRSEAKAKHNQTYWLFSRLPLNFFWLLLPLTVSLVGAYLLWRKCSAVTLLGCFT